MVDLGATPLANSYLEPADLLRPERHYPLCVYVCDACRLAQLPAVVPAKEIFSEYAYFSSYSSSWLEHAERYATMACERFALGHTSYVVELASNEGYLRRYFAARGVAALGVEPARNVAEHARARGIDTDHRFFGERLGRELGERRRADLVVANHVLAHVPELNDFIAGIPHLLAPHGVWTIEVPHLLRLLERVQFDTIYHEHYSYFSFLTVDRLFASHGLVLFDVEERPTHGGSLRIYAHHRDDHCQRESSRVAELLRREAAAGLDSLATYAGFGRRVQATKRSLLRFLIDCSDAGRTVAGYGAPAKGNTLLNYCGVRADLLAYTVDRSPHKQGRYLPGSRIPMRGEDELRMTRPDYVLLLPWNLEGELREKLAYVAEWGGQLVVPIPEVRVVPAAAPAAR